MVDDQQPRQHDQSELRQAMEVEMAQRCWPGSGQQGFFFAVAVAVMVSEDFVWEQVAEASEASEERVEAASSLTAAWAYLPCRSNCADCGGEESVQVRDR